MLKDRTHRNYTVITVYQHCLMENIYKYVKGLLYDVLLISLFQQEMNLYEYDDLLSYWNFGISVLHKHFYYVTISRSKYNTIKSASLY